jgi:hypothetical protein
MTAYRAVRRRDARAIRPRWPFWLQSMSGKRPRNAAGPKLPQVIRVRFASVLAADPAGTRAAKAPRSVRAQARVPRQGDLVLSRISQRYRRGRLERRRRRWPRPSAAPSAGWRLAQRSRGWRRWRRGWPAWSPRRLLPPYAVQQPGDRFRVVEADASGCLCTALGRCPGPQDRSVAIKLMTELRRSFP